MASKQWDDIYFRDNFSDTGSYPTSGKLCHSPDIIPNGTDVLGNPKDLITSTAWKKYFNKKLVSGMANYIYLRGMNLASGANAGDMYLYWSKASLLLYPNQWRKNQLKTSDGAGSVKVNAAKKDDKVVTGNPFTWDPTMISGDHYCLIARVVTEKHQANIPATGDIDSLATFISENPNFAWHNVSVVDAGRPTWTQTIDYEQGDLEADVRFFLECSNVPVGAEVAFSCGSPGTTPPIQLDKTKVTDSTTFNVGMTAHVPKGFSSTISYSYWDNGHKPLPGFRISLLGIYLVKPPNKLFSRATELGELHVSPDSEMKLLDKIGPVKGCYVGGFSTIII